jgi:hypothetical protein
MALRNQYVAQRIGARMKSRGEAMVLRRISMLPGPEPFKNPPDVSDDLTVVAGNLISGQQYLNLAGSTAIGRLVPGDQVISVGSPNVIWTVVTMPPTVMTDSDGIPQVDGSGAPLFGTPPVYHADTLAAPANSFPVVPVTGAFDVTQMPGHLVSFVFFADATVYGNPLSLEQMTRMGWIEVDAIGLSIAAHGVNPPPKVNDLIILVSSGNEKRAIIQTGRRFSNGTNFLFPVQAR